MDRQAAIGWVEFYIGLGAAIVWTDAKAGEAAKRVASKGWNEALPLAGEQKSLAGQFAERLKTRNPALVTANSGLVSVDCDDEAGLEAFRSLGLPKTLEVQSSTPHKRHYHYRAPEGAEFSYFEFAGQAVKAKRNQYLLVPPALHPSGASYRFVPNGNNGQPSPIATLTQADFEKLVHAAEATKARRDDPGEKIPDGGGRHATFVSKIGAWRAQGTPLEMALEEGRRFSATKFDPPYTDAQVEQKVRDIYDRYPAGAPTPQAEKPLDVSWDDNLAGLLDDICRLTRHYIVIDEEEARAGALWLAHTYIIEKLDVTAYLHIYSAVRECGKSHYQDVLAALAYRPRMGADLSDAVLFRLIDSERPTLFLDEIDALFSGRKEETESKRGLLNQGYERGRPAWRMGGRNMQELQEFETFCAKCFASIGSLPDTIQSRSIRIKLRRKKKTDKVARFRKRRMRAQAASLRARLEAWSESCNGSFEVADERLPEELDGRTLDIWEPLIAIADLAGDEWAEEARRLAVLLSVDGDNEEETTTSIRLLRSIRDAFERANTDRLLTVDLITSICDDEEAPWRGWWWNDRDSKPTKDAPAKVARLLRNFDIRPKVMRVDEERGRGYDRAQFTDAFERYLCPPAEGRDTVTNSMDTANAPVNTTRDNPVTPLGTGHAPLGHEPRDVMGTRDATTPDEQGDVTCSHPPAGGTGEPALDQEPGWLARSLEEDQDEGEA